MPLEPKLRCWLFWDVAPHFGGFCPWAETRHTHLGRKPDHEGDEVKKKINGIYSGFHRNPREKEQYKLEGEAVWRGLKEELKGRQNLDQVI